MIVKTKVQAIEVALDNGYKVDVTHRFTNKMRCKCYPAWKFWKPNLTEYFIGGMIEDGVWEILTILYCTKCGQDYGTSKS